VDSFAQIGIEKLEFEKFEKLEFVSNWKRIQSLVYCFLVLFSNFFLQTKFDGAQNEVVGGDCIFLEKEGHFILCLNGVVPIEDFPKNWTTQKCARQLFSKIINHTTFNGEEIAKRLRYLNTLRPSRHEHSGSGAEAAELNSRTCRLCRNLFFQQGWGDIGVARDVLELLCVETGQYREQDEPGAFPESPLFLPNPRTTDDVYELLDGPHVVRGVTVLIEGEKVGSFII